MKQTILIILIFIVLISCQNKSQEGKIFDSINYSDTTIVEHQTPDGIIEFEPYDYDTILSGGYNFKYKVYTDKTGEKLQSLTLRKGDDEIKVLNETSFPMLFKNLGYIGADFDSSFVFVQSFGSGNPHEIQLIDKKTGKELRKGTWVDVDEKEQVMLYIENEHEQNEKLLIYDIKNRNEILSTGFEKSKCVEHVIGGLRNCVEIDTVTTDEIVLKIDTDEEKIIKKYNR
ncbi:hypothetical protein [Paenimyroides aestuarii]|uniref:Lipoprotein n=1 Tax=Paenimyroides aestuarii TaxID=2968490 RepID=A0ABY5NU24_9FLAO|nr:hypothetical protein [Paenimyroides aestuarii]UUV22088.1 hypothetical protein NPX36_03325 [Paenimyroides aestuarii]